jgi:hypothetical protein
MVVDRFINAVLNNLPLKFFIPCAMSSAANYSLHAGCDGCGTISKTGNNLHS